MIRLLALAWAGLAATVLVRRWRGIPVRARSAALANGELVNGELALKHPVPTPAPASPPVLRRRVGLSRRSAPVEAVGFDLALLADLVRAGILAGLNPFLALLAAVEAGGGSTPDDLGDAFRAVRTGSSLGDAAAGAALRAPAVGPLLEAITSATRSGAPLAPGLERLAAGARRSARLALATRARAAPVRLLFPLVFLGLPAFGLLVLAPVVLSGPLF